MINDACEVGALLKKIETITTATELTHPEAKIGFAHLAGVFSIDAEAIADLLSLGAEEALRRIEAVQAVEMAIVKRDEAQVELDEATTKL